MKNAQIALVTGATSGIGAATAAALASAGYDLIITGRRAERLKALKEELQARHGGAEQGGYSRDGEKRHEAGEGVEVLTLAFDVADPHQVAAMLGTLPGRWRKIDVLVNNAGLAVGLEHIHEGDPGDWETMIDTNVKGLLWVTRVVAGMMIEHGGGHIVNLGSLAGRQVYENGAVYCATKHAVNALSQGMRIDFLRHGIRVTEVRPGMVETEFSQVRFHGDKARAAAVYEGMDPLTAADIADAIVWAVTRPPHMSIDEIALTPRRQANMYHFDRCNK